MEAVYTTGWRWIGQEVGVDKSLILRADQILATYSHHVRLPTLRPDGRGPTLTSARRLIILIFAGRNRMVMIRVEALPSGS